MRLIDADELKEGLEQHFKSTDEYELDGIDHAFNRGYNSGLERALFSIIHAKVVDAVPVVRCKECKHWNQDEVFKTSSCRILYDGNGFEKMTDAVFFCGYGKRKDGE